MILAGNTRSAGAALLCRAQLGFCTVDATRTTSPLTPALPLNRSAELLLGPLEYSRSEPSGSSALRSRFRGRAGVRGEKVGLIHLGMKMKRAHSRFIPLKLAFRRKGQRYYPRPLNAQSKPFPKHPLIARPSCSSMLSTPAFVL